ncbi:MAG: AAA family ATPase [Pseudomonadota bacterium]|nr:AAA family ATPase [Pseudomonadota bacterium]
MAKILIEDPDENTQVPFLRGILTRSLQNAGLAFEVAYNAASDIRKDLDDEALITTHELRDRVIKHLKATCSAKVVERYESQGAAATATRVEHADGRVTTFSADLHRRRLETIGLTHEESFGVIAKIQQYLADNQLSSTTSQHIAHLSYRYLHQTPELGPAVARRWLVWIDFLRSGRPLILLIGGTSGCGKSTIATALANQLEIVRTQSTDMLREVMRTMISKRLLPVLHQSSFSAWEALPLQEGRLTEDQELLVADGFLAQVDLLSVASEAVIERALRERVSLIFEGVHIHQSMVDKIPRDTDALIAPIMLAVLKRKDLKERIRGRGTRAPERRSERYLEHFDEIWQLQSFLLSEADRTKTPIIVNGDRDKVVREIMRTVIDMLSKDFALTPEEVFR